VWREASERWIIAQIVILERVGGRGHAEIKVTRVACNAVNHRKHSRTDGGGAKRIEVHITSGTDGALDPTRKLVGCKHVCPTRRFVAPAGALPRHERFHYYVKGPPRRWNGFIYKHEHLLPGCESQTTDLLG